jgi:hypothetical protein
MALTNKLTDLAQQQLDVHGFLEFGCVLGLISETVLESVEDDYDGLVTMSILISGMERALSSNTALDALVHTLKNISKTGYHQEEAMSRYLDQAFLVLFLVQARMRGLRAGSTRQL